MKKLVVFTAIALSWCAMASPARAFTHPGIPLSIDDLATIKASLNQNPWKDGYANLSSSSQSKLTYTMQGPFTTVSRNPDVNLNQWKSDTISS